MNDVRHERNTPAMLNLDYRLVRPLLFLVEPEAAHPFTIASLRRAGHFDRALRALKKFAPPSKPKALCGLNFPSPVGLAAGLDKNGVALPVWAALGLDRKSTRLNSSH